MKRLLFTALRYPIIAFRRIVCKVAGHKMYWNGYYEAAKQGSSFDKIMQCQRCRFIQRNQPDAVVIRLDPSNPYQ
jgi:hypothetical protein